MTPAPFDVDQLIESLAQNVADDPAVGIRILEHRYDYGVVVVSCEVALLDIAGASSLSLDFAFRLDVAQRSATEMGYVDGKPGSSPSASEKSLGAYLALRMIEDVLTLRFEEGALNFIE